MTIYFIDGQFTEKDSMNISIDDRGYYFGDGVYEVVKVYDGELYTAEQHFERLFQSASKIKMSYTLFRTAADRYRKGIGQGKRRENRPYLYASDPRGFSA